MMKTLFVTYGSHSNYLEAAIRLSEQVKQTKLFDKIIVLDDPKLIDLSPYWRKLNKRMQELDAPGRHRQAGKTFLMKYVFSDLCTEFDVVMYADPGCEIPNNLISKMRFKTLLRGAYNFGGIAEQLDYPEYMYTKRALLEFIGDRPDIRNTGQIQATWFILKNNSLNVNLIDKWLTLTDPTLGLWQDPSERERMSQSSGFIDHRRDQSIFSLLWKEFLLPIKAPYWEFGARVGAIRGLIEPIHTSRNKSGVSNLPKFHENTFLAIVGVLVSFIASSNRILRRHKYEKKTSIGITKKVINLTT
jgi:hypothetical protein